MNDGNDRRPGAPSGPGRPRAGAILHWKGKRLSPFQVQAVEAIRAGHDVLVSAPTGAGKTLVAEYAIEDAARRGKRCIYTAPIKALSNQKYRDFRDDPAIDVGLMTGDVTIHPAARVLIMTTEILRNAIFENPEHLSEVEYVVFDEVHYMDDLERGSVWEESPDLRPTRDAPDLPLGHDSNVHELGEWLTEIRSREMVVISSNRRPVPLAHWLYTERSGVFAVHDLGPGAQERAGPGRARLRAPGSARVARVDRVDRSSAPRRARQPLRAERATPDVGPLIDDLQERALLPALVFAFSRKDCERLALANAGRALLDVLEQERMDALVRDLLQIFQLEERELAGSLLSMARRGIAYHHAGMLPLHKELVERLFTSGLLKLLFTTETFALGINMPARTVVFHSLRKFDGTNFNYMLTRDYLQMAGRAGRQGIDAEGLVIALLSARDLVEAPIERLTKGRAEPVESRFRLSFSSLLHLVERLGRARVTGGLGEELQPVPAPLAEPKQQDKNRREQSRCWTRTSPCSTSWATWTGPS
jgi:superfamily II RNA helicase